MLGSHGQMGARAGAVAGEISNGSRACHSWIMKDHGSSCRSATTTPAVSSYEHPSETRAGCNLHFQVPTDDLDRLEVHTWLSAGAAVIEGASHRLEVVPSAGSGVASSLRVCTVLFHIWHVGPKTILVFSKAEDSWSLQCKALPPNREGSIHLHCEALCNDLMQIE
jgi:hypothetical protein